MHTRQYLNMTERMALDAALRAWRGVLARRYPLQTLRGVA